MHNAAASYVAAECGIAGPTLTVTQFLHSFEEGLALALSWIKEGRVPRVLLGAVDVHGDVLGYVAGRMLTPSPDGRLQPFEMDPANKYVPGEGAAFFLLEATPDEAYCSVGVETGFSVSPSGREGVISVPCADGLMKDETGYLELIPAGAPVASFAPHFGSMMTGSAFQAAASALMLRDKTVWPSQSDTVNPHGLLIAGPGTTVPTTAPSSVEVLRLGYSGRRGLVTLSAL